MQALPGKHRMPPRRESRVFQRLSEFAAEGCPEHAARRFDSRAVRSERERDAGERRVDADDTPAGVQERAAAVAGV